MAAPSRRGRWRGAVLVALVAIGLGVVGLAVYELATGGAFYAERGGGSATLVAQFVLYAVVPASVVAAFVVPFGSLVGWLLGGRRS